MRGGGGGCGGGGWGVERYAGAGGCLEIESDGQRLWWSVRQ